jgi:hypothetical protein
MLKEDKVLYSICPVEVLVFLWIHLEVTKKCEFDLQAVVDEWASSLFRVCLDLFMRSCEELVFLTTYFVLISFYYAVWLLRKLYVSFVNKTCIIYISIILLFEEYS